MRKLIEWSIKFFAFRPQLSSKGLLTHRLNLEWKLNWIECNEYGIQLEIPSFIQRTSKYVHHRSSDVEQIQSNRGIHDHSGPRKLAWNMLLCSNILEWKKEEQLNCSIVHKQKRWFYQFDMFSSCILRGRYRLNSPPTFGRALACCPRSSWQCTCVCNQQIDSTFCQPRGCGKREENAELSKLSCIVHRIEMD